MNYLKTPIFRSEALRRAVAELACVNCGRVGSTQAAHTNTGKGQGIKASDARIMALCTGGLDHRGCHEYLDQSGRMTREQRREFESEMTLRTLVALIERGVLVVDTKRFREGRAL